MDMKIFPSKSEPYSYKKIAPMLVGEPEFWVRVGGIKCI